MDQAASIEAREADCKSAADLAALARQAHALDTELAKDLLGKAEAQCQMPADHLAVAALDQAEALGGDRFVFAELARVAASLGLGGKIAPLLEKAAGHCTSAAPARWLADRLLVTGCDWENVRALYGGLRDRCQGVPERLAWADGVLEVFRDRQWAREVYQ
jgi:hypothetical protein